MTWNIRGISLASARYTSVWVTGLTWKSLLREGERTSCNSHCNHTQNTVLLHASPQEWRISLISGFNFLCLLNLTVGTTINSKWAVSMLYSLYVQNHVRYRLLLVLFVVVEQNLLAADDDVLWKRHSPNTSGLWEVFIVSMFNVDILAPQSEVAACLTSPHLLDPSKLFCVVAHGERQPALQPRFYADRGTTQTFWKLELIVCLCALSHVGFDSALVCNSWTTLT